MLLKTHVEKMSLSGVFNYVDENTTTYSAFSTRLMKRQGVIENKADSSQPTVDRKCAVYPRFVDVLGVLC
jgi:hypothetical protein